MGEASRIAMAAGEGIAQPHVNHQLVSLLENALAQVRQGQLTSVLVVGVSPMGQIGTISAGLQVADLYLGADMFKGAILQAMQRPMSSSIIKPQ